MADPKISNDPAAGTTSDARPVAANFVHDLAAEHAAQGTFGGRVVTRFPP
ncbi:MAG: hypothetical protein ACKVG5_10845, partial [Acidimicrobiales bacterium]